MEQGGGWGLAALKLDVVKRDNMNNPALSKMRGETGEEGREGSRCVSEQLRIQCVVVRKVCDISSQICVSRDTDRIER